MEILLAIIIVAIIIAIYYYYNEGFLHYTSGGKQRFASEFTGTDQAAQQISQQAFASQIMQADSDITLQNQANTVNMTSKIGMGESFNTKPRKNMTHIENYAGDDFRSLVLESVLLNRNIAETGVSGTEVLLQNNLHGDLYDNYL